MKILFLTKYDSLGASSRYRFFQFYDFYKENNLKIDSKPFFDDDYLIELYNGKRNIKSIFKAYIKRFLVLFSLKRYDLLIVEKELFPYLPAIFEKFLNFLEIKYIVDYDDAIFHQYNNSNNKLIKFLLSDKISKVMKYSSLVVAGNNYLADYAKKNGKPKVVVIPTVIDLEKYDQVLAPKKNNEEIIIGWIGSPSTAKYLTFIENVFIELSKIYNIKVHIIGTFISPFKVFNSNLILWSEDIEIEEMKKFDIGIMPLIDSPWERGKCGFKLIQYMGCSLPVVGSPVGVNSEIIEHGKNGFLAISVEEWKLSLELLIKDEYLRKQFGQKGRDKVEKNYSKNTVKNKLLELYKDSNS